jgi:hypothetical protein
MSATGFKQLQRNNGYYINVADSRTTFYQNNGTDFVPLISSSQLVAGNVSTLLQVAGRAIFRDHGKTLTSSGRVFRKVQLMVSTGQVYASLGGVQSGGVISGGTDGIAGSDNLSLQPNSPPNFLTGYIELPGLGTGSGVIACTPVARLG